MDFRLVWLGFELFRHAVRGRAAWTWRRTKAHQMNRQHTDAVACTLVRIAQ